MSVKPEPPTKFPGRTVSLFVIYSVEFACKWSSQVRVNVFGLGGWVRLELEWRMANDKNARETFGPQPKANIDSLPSLIPGAPGSP